MAAVLFEGRGVPRGVSVEAAPFMGLCCGSGGLQPHAKIKRRVRAKVLSLLAGGTTEGSMPQ